jgi:hypothetical protein
LPIFSADLQIRLWTRLQLLRKQHLGDALADAVSRLDVPKIDADLARFVGRKQLSLLATLGLRGEVFFPVPIVLMTKPELLGYYRLLYGISQKEFYSKGGLGRYRSMEEANRVSSPVALRLPELCKCLIASATMLLAGVAPISINSVHELQLLTLGPQLRGSENNKIGRGASEKVFELVKGLTARNTISSTAETILVKNAAGRSVKIAFASDPDIAIFETMPTNEVPIVSIEIKGGADVSNVHNRIGEAEKSHQKARGAGFNIF